MIVWMPVWKDPSHCPPCRISWKHFRSAEVIMCSTSAIFLLAMRQRWCASPICVLSSSMMLYRPDTMIMWPLQFNKPGRKRLRVSHIYCKFVQLTSFFLLSDNYTNIPGRHSMKNKIIHSNNWDLLFASYRLHWCRNFYYCSRGNDLGRKVCMFYLQYLDLYAAII